jgi:hypothetical protein
LEISEHISSSLSAFFEKEGKKCVEIRKLFECLRDSSFYSVDYKEVSNELCGMEQFCDDAKSGKHFGVAISMAIMLIGKNSTLDFPIIQIEVDFLLKTDTANSVFYTPARNTLVEKLGQIKHVVRLYDEKVDVQSAKQIELLKHEIDDLTTTQSALIDDITSVMVNYEQKIADLESKFASTSATLEAYIVDHADSELLMRECAESIEETTKKNHAFHLNEGILFAKIEDLAKANKDFAEGYDLLLSDYNRMSYDLHCMSQELNKFCSKAASLAEENSILTKEKTNLMKNFEKFSRSVLVDSGFRV